MDEELVEAMGSLETTLRKARDEERSTRATARGPGGPEGSTMFTTGTDIIEALRTEPAEWESCPVELTVLVNAAADEIERLRTRIGYMADDNSPHDAQASAQRLAAEWDEGWRDREP